MNAEYVIVQAGGKGTRLGTLTKNKPKAIVSVDNLPMIFHLMKIFRGKKFIVIGDYKIDVLEKYLEIFSPEDFFVVKAEGSGTCAGIKNALKIVPQKKSFMLIWSDLILDENFSLEKAGKNSVGISCGFSCRWSYKNKIFSEVPSAEFGVAGLFVFTDKEILSDVPDSGEFVKFLSQKKIDFDELKLSGAREVGTLLSYDSCRKKNVCRPFNSVEISAEKVVKKPLDEQGRKIAQDEIGWYRKMNELNFSRIPKIFSYEPLVMERINGRNAFDPSLNLSAEQKKIVLKNYVDSLLELHAKGNCAADFFSLQENYYTKTMERLDRVRNLIPLAERDTISVNGRKCMNVFFHRAEFKRAAERILYDAKFSVIHGDCTFSNSLVDENLNVIFFDPRGYFGETKIFGDEYYDFAKLYYSAVGNYDQFNAKNFDLEISADGVKISVAKNGFGDLEEYFFSLIPDCNPEKIRLIHAVIWLSLCTYAWDDYDSICGAFYNGIFYLNEFLGGGK